MKDKEVFFRSIVSMEKPALVWIRNDLRLHDNPALFEAVAKSRQVVLLYIYDASSLGSSFPGGASRVWLGRALDHFGEKVRQKGFGWVIREGVPLDILKVMVRELQCSHVFWNRRYEPEGVQQDVEAEELLSQDGISVHTFQGNILVEPWKVMTKKETPFTVFTPFMQAFKELCPNTCEVPEVQPLPFTHELFSLCPKALPLTPRYLDWPKHVLKEWKVGEEGALELLHEFCLHKLSEYSEKRDFPYLDATSRLSCYLHFGEISPRRVWNMVLAYERKTRRNIGETFLKELVWREFCYYILYHFPKTEREPLKEGFQAFPWRKNDLELRAWQEGRTGIPFVDAGMRQLWETGWMHNRVRMITATFLVKHLLHHWKEGLLWFWDTLVDGDAACNAYNWQWVAGSGASAPPFFRIFNPVVQAKRFDPEGEYVKKFIPELSKVPAAYIHTPWEAPMADLRSWGVSLGETYPWPIVDIDTGRKRAVEAYSRR